MSTSAQEKYRNYNVQQLFRLIDKLERRAVEMAGDMSRASGMPIYEKVCRLQEELDQAYGVIGEYQDWHREHEYKIIDGPSLRHKSYDGLIHFNPKNALPKR